MGSLFGPSMAPHATSKRLPATTPHEKGPGDLRRAMPAIPHENGRGDLRRTLPATIPHENGRGDLRRASPATTPHENGRGDLRRALPATTPHEKGRGDLRRALPAIPHENGRGDLRRTLPATIPHSRKKRRGAKKTGRRNGRTSEPRSSRRMAMHPKPCPLHAYRTSRVSCLKPRRAQGFPEPHSAQETPPDERQSNGQSFLSTAQ